MSDIEIIRGNVRVMLENIGEGLEGDYNADDPEDCPLMRFSVYGRNMADNGGLEEGHEQDNGWTPFRDASYCTMIDADLKKKELKAYATRIMDEVYDSAVSGSSIKRLCEKLSWMGHGNS